MSIFPTDRAARGRREDFTGRDLGPETDGVLVQPIAGQIYLVEEEDLERQAEEETQSLLYGLVNRH